MFHKRQPKKDIKKIGKNKYIFDFDQEIIIYKYVCCKRLKKRELKKLNKNQKFDYYSEWKQSICDRYKDYNNEKLLNFSRYLNQRIRNVRPNKEYSKMYTPIILSLGITSVYNALMNTEENDLIDYSTALKISFTLIYVFLIVASLFFLVWYTYKPIFENDDEENLLKDYKEIIDEILDVRKKEKKYYIKKD